MNLVSKGSQEFLQRQEIIKIDGYIAIIFALYNLLLTCLYLYILKSGVFDHYSKSYIQFICGSIMLLCMFIPLLIILKIRKQSLSSIGLGKFGLHNLVLCAVLLLAYVLYYISHNGFDSNLFFRLYYFVVTIGFFEEILFRGFIWPRFMTIMGPNWGTVVTGVLFGFFHAPKNVILYHQNVYLELFNNIGPGIVGQLIFGYLYTKSKHVIFSSWIHGLLDGMQK